jgi:serine phosphatase RsbU (regulator of sigma subunit)
MELNVSSAICVPLMLGATPAALLYLDSRGRAGALRQGSAAFCVALGRMASLALGNLKRVDIERRQASMEAELTAAAEAQKWILPPREIKIGNVHIIGESRAGHFVGGDFFDIIQLADDRVAVALGDVSGHGVAASVLMTATQSFLHATLLANPDPGWAAIMANRFIHPRREGNRFVTMWLGIFDPRAGKLTYVDAGHGYGLMSHADGTLTTLNAERGLPLGVVDDSEYVVATTELKPESCVLVVSDGIIEQPRKAIDGAEREKRVQFDLGGVKDVLSTAGDGCDVISALFDAVVRHAGTTELSDDATAVMVRWKC